MANYRAVVTVNFYRTFEFEADDIDLAYDHIEHLAEHMGPAYILNEWEESGPEEIFVEVEEAR